MAVRVAVVQRQPAPGDVAANLATVDAVGAALAGVADAVVLPELFVTGYRVGGVEALAEPLDGPSVTALARIARRHRLLVVCGLPERAGDLVHNAAVVLDADGTVLGAYRKNHLFGSEPEAFTAGTGLPVFDTVAGRVGVLVCYDVELPEPARRLAGQGAELILVPAANMDPYAVDHEVLPAARALENRVPVAVANQVGQVGPLRMCGGSRIVSATGEVLAAAGRGPALLVAELPPR